jgi:hypothetical protein
MTRRGRILRDTNAGTGLLVVDETQLAREQAESALKSARRQGTALAHVAVVRFGVRRHRCRLGWSLEYFEQ